MNNQKLIMCAEQLDSKLKWLINNNASNDYIGRDYIMMCRQTLLDCLVASHGPAINDAVYLAMAEYLLNTSCPKINVWRRIMADYSSAKSLAEMKIAAMSRNR